MIHDGILFRLDNFEKWPNKAEDILQDGMWKDKECFIIGGGESLKGFDFSKLDGKLTIGINRSIEVYDSTLWYGMDWHFLKYVENGKVDQDKWNNYKGIKVFSMPEFDGIFHKDLYFAKRTHGGLVNQSLEQGIDPGTNSGYGAIMLAVALGVKTIFLLGYDMTVVEKTHWHEGYPGQNFADQKWRTERFATSFEMTAGTIRGLGISVYNLSPISKLTCYPKVGLEAAFPTEAPVASGQSEFHDLYY